MGFKTSLRAMIYSETFAPAVRIELLVLYGFAVLHKLNKDFLDPEVSCAGHMLRTLADLLPFLPTAQWASLLSIWITLTIEACIPSFCASSAAEILAFFWVWGSTVCSGFTDTEGCTVSPRCFLRCFSYLRPRTLLPT